MEQASLVTGTWVFWSKPKS